MTSHREPIARSKTQELLARTAGMFTRNPFRPHPLFSGGHAQTLVAYAWPRGLNVETNDEKRLFHTASDAQVLAYCRWQTDRKDHPTIVIWHGMEGSTESRYMLAMANKGFAAGFNVIRVNVRNCGGTEHLTPTLYHGGLTEDLRAVFDELINQDGLSRLVLVGFSLGGNMVLKLAAEYGSEYPEQLLAICAVSPSVDLGASTNEMQRRGNWIYQQSFLRRLHQRMRLKKDLFPDLYDISELHLANTIREFDERFTSRASGFEGADDYYHRASSIRQIHKIEVPTLIIHAEDDPFIPFAPLRANTISDNPNILLIATKHGGHVAFLARADGQNEDRFWAENRVIDFCKLAIREG
jgi:uncharacterized protein